MKKQKKVFVICSMQDTVTYRKLENYKNQLESMGYEVYLSCDDSNQENSYEKCMQNMQAILEADEIHIFNSSSDTRFDLGMAFFASYMNPTKVVKLIEYEQEMDVDGQWKLSFERSFDQLFYDWEKIQHERNVV